MKKNYKYKAMRVALFISFHFFSFLFISFHFFSLVFFGCHFVSIYPKDTLNFSLITRKDGAFR